MEILRDIIDTNKGIFTKSLGSALKNWKIFFVGYAYLIASLVMWRVAAKAWILSGIVITIFQSAIISNYLYLIENIIQYDQFTIEDFKYGFKIYLSKVYMILIFFWFISYGLDIFFRPIFYVRIGFITLWGLLQVIAFVLLNPLPETIYQKHHFGFDIFSYTFDFVKSNFIEWFVPNIIIFLIGYFLYRGYSNLAIQFTNNILARNVIFLLNTIIYQLFFSFFMIYRGHLFNILSNSTRRKRMYMRNMYKD